MEKKELLHCVECGGYLSYDPVEFIRKLTMPEVVALRLAGETEEVLCPVCAKNKYSFSHKATVAFALAPWPREDPCPREGE
jgi:hypothetical protein